jgi:hypothetical protein
MVVGVVVGMVVCMRYVCGSGGAVLAVVVSIGRRGPRFCQEAEVVAAEVVGPKLKSNGNGICSCILPLPDRLNLHSE